MRTAAGRRGRSVAPQSVFVDLEAAGEITGSVLDVGCGTGENALHMAERGHEVWGVDISGVAVERAMVKAHARRLPVVFLMADALEPEEVGRTFDTIIDCGCFHTLSDDDRVRYAASIRALTEPGGRLVINVLLGCRAPRLGAAARNPRLELRDTFATGWDADAIQAVRFETLLGPDGAAGPWLAATFHRAT